MIQQFGVDVLSAFGFVDVSSTGVLENFVRSEDWEKNGEDVVSTKDAVVLSDGEMVLSDDVDDGSVVEWEEVVDDVRAVVVEMVVVVVVEVVVVLVVEMVVVLVVVGGGGVGQPSFRSKLLSWNS